MTLGFSTHWPDGKTPTLFPEKIQYPYVPEIQKFFPDMLPKIHTFRAGRRWRAGMKMHMVIGNRTPHRYQFNTDIPELSICKSVQQCRITLLNGRLYIRIGTDQQFNYLERPELLLFATNDGFNSLEELKQWFFPEVKEGKNQHWEGQIIHFTNFQY